MTMRLVVGVALVVAGIARTSEAQALRVAP
jgi:hypothetical protein